MIEKKQQIKEKIEKVFKDKNVIEFEKRVNSINYLGIFSIERRETAHSSFLQWFFNMKIEPIKVKNYSLKKLLSLLFKKNNSLLKEDESFRKKVIDRNIELGLDFFEDKTEFKIGKKRGDLIISFAFRSKTEEQNIKWIDIIIENKIGSKEHNKQTLYYEKHIVELNKELEKIIPKENRIKAFVYLTPRKDDKPKSTLFQVVTYQELLDEVLYPTFEELKEKDKDYYLINDYIHSLSFSKKNNSTIMGVINRDINMINDIWKKYRKELIELYTFIKIEKNKIADKKIIGKINTLNYLFNEELLKFNFSSEVVEGVNDLLKIKESISSAGYIRVKLKELLKESKIEKEDFDNLLSKPYCSKEFSLNYSLLSEVNLNDSKKDKYNKNKIKFNDRYFVVCSEIYEKNKVEFDKWLTKNFIS